MMEKKAKSTMLAFIREDECIGCTKCIQACPVDAIIGTNQKMHTVLIEECIGCKLCVVPCPVDCIDMIMASEKKPPKDQLIKRYKARQARLNQQNLETKISDKKTYINNVLLRIKIKTSKIGSGL